MAGKSRALFGSPRGKAAGTRRSGTPRGEGRAASAPPGRPSPFSLASGSPFESASSHTAATGTPPQDVPPLTLPQRLLLSVGVRAVLLVCWLTSLAAALLDTLLRFPFFDLLFVGRPLDVLSASWAVAARLFAGCTVARGVEGCARPGSQLKLYETLHSAECRMVREALDTLDLDALVLPCPASSAFVLASGSLATMLKPICRVCRAIAPKLTARGEGLGAALLRQERLDRKPRVESRFRSAEAGLQQLPVLVDGSRHISGGKAIVEHLFTHYGATARPPLNYRLISALDRHLAPLGVITAALRPLPHHGWCAVPSKHAAKPLELWGNESSPFVMRVQEALFCLQLPYVYVHAAFGSAKRSKLTDSMQVPMLIDPNGKGARIVESKAIVRYLYATYGLPHA
mmetsp:Transcript_12611/g.28450  ORF Transcript_12611/g.28450 Transcript_12611/m.28450 type:complete len:401 (+) Transcript_12611:14-1216(+)